MARLDLDAKTGAERRIAAWLEEHASEELAAKIAAAGPSMAKLMGHISDQARKLDNTGGAVMVEDDVVFGWAVHFYEDLAKPEKANHEEHEEAEDLKDSEINAENPVENADGGEFAGMDLFGGVE